MTQEESIYYENLKNNPSINNYVFDKLFTVINGTTVAKPNVALQLVGGIPMVYNSFTETNTLDSLFPSGLSNENSIEKNSTQYALNSTLGENSIFHPNFDKKRKEEVEKKRIFEITKEINLAYETDGHYSTVYLVCLMLGMAQKKAEELAKATEAPDTTIHTKTKFELNDTWGHIDGSQQEIHSLTGGFHGIEEFFTAIKFLYTPENKIEELGKLLHRFGDTYAHTEINNIKPEDVKENIDFDSADDKTREKYIEAWKIKSEKSLKSSVSPWLKFFNYYLGKFGFEFLDNEKKQKEIFKGRTLKQALKDIYLTNDSADFIMYGEEGYTFEHAFTDGGYPDMIFLRPNWYRLYIQNLSWLIATKFKLNLAMLDLSIFDRMINFVTRDENKCSMKGIIDYEITKKLQKNVIYIPVYYADGKFLASMDEVKTNYLETAKKVCEKTKKYMIEQNIKKEKIMTYEISEKKIIVSASSIGYASSSVIDEIISYKITF